MSIRRMLDRTATIYRMVSPGTGELNTPLPPVKTAVAEGVLCAMARQSFAFNQEAARPELVSSIRLYFLPDVDIRPGDLINITGAGVFRAGIPYRPRNHHIEVDVKAEGEA